MTSVLVRRGSHHGNDDDDDLLRAGILSVSHVAGMTNSGVRKKPSKVFSQISAI